MIKSNVTDFILSYMQENQISAAEVSEYTGISVSKLQPDYTEPLLAEEFLELCVFLHLSPEAVLCNIR